MSIASIVKWDDKCYITDETVTQDVLFSLDTFISDLALLGIDEDLVLTVAELEYVTEDEADTENNLHLISDNLVDMLNDDVVGLTSCRQFTLKGIENRQKGLDSHIADIKRYYTANPFM